jgi:hypothetical protein
MNVSTLRDYRAEIDTDELVRGYDGMSNKEVADDMNTAYIDAPLRKVTPAEYLNWASFNGRALKIKDGITTGANDDTKNTCYLWDLMLQAGQTGPDPGNATHVAQVDLMVSQGVLEASDKAALVSVATDQITRCMDIGVPPAKEGYIERARALA